MTLLNIQGNYLAGGDIELSTRKNTHIPNVPRKPRPPVAMEATRDMVLREHSSASVRSLHSMYNCMGMVFGSRRTWIEPTELPVILKEDEYRQVDRSDLECGDVVVYRRDGLVEASHVGIVAKVRVNVREAKWEVLVLSQWGRHGEYFHLDEDVDPRLGKPAEYWTDRIGA